MKMAIKVCAAAMGSLAVAAGSLGLAVGGCSSSTPSGTTTTSGSGTGTGSTTSTTSATTTVSGSTTAAGPCTAANNIFEVVFSPMYSAVIPGSTAQSFQVPAVVTGVNAAAVSWSASSNAVTLSADPSTGGVLITMNSSGSGGAVTITASSGGSCGQSTLNITPSTEAAWMAGSSRYNDGVPIPANPIEVFKPDGGPDSLRIACVNCHAPKGEDAGMGFGFNDVAHTPEQTGGFSDAVLLAIVQNGAVPGWSTDAAAVPGLQPGQTSEDAGYFDPTITSFAEWHRFHQWNLTTEEQAGIVTYLRSLTPTAQGGTADFGGGGHFGDGGFHHHHDGGFMGSGSGSGMPSGSASGSGSGDATVP